MNILHIEDSLKMQQLLKHSLSDLNEQIEGATTVASGLKKLVEHVPDVAIVDIKLPDGNGIDLARWIKGRYPRMRVIILSNDVEICYRTFSRKAGVDYFFDKSMEFDKVRSALLEINSVINN